MWTRGWLENEKTSLFFHWKKLYIVIVFMVMKMIGKMAKKRAKSRHVERQGKKQENMHKSMEKITLREIKYIPIRGRFKQMANVLSHCSTKILDGDEIWYLDASIIADGLHKPFSFSNNPKLKMTKKNRNSCFKLWIQVLGNFSIVVRFFSKKLWFFGKNCDVRFFLNHDFFQAKNCCLEKIAILSF